MMSPFFLIVNSGHDGFQRTERRFNRKIRPGNIDKYTDTRRGKHHGRSMTVLPTIPFSIRSSPLLLTIRSARGFRRSGHLRRHRPSGSADESPRDRGLHRILPYLIRRSLHSTSPTSAENTLSGPSTPALSFLDQAKHRGGPSTVYWIL